MLNLDHSSQNEPALGQARTSTLHQQQRAGLRPCSQDANTKFWINFTVNLTKLLNKFVKF